MDQLIELFWVIISAKKFTYMVVLTMVGVICWVMTEFMKLPGLAILFAPFLVFSGLAGNYITNLIFYLPMKDRDANVAVASGAGVLFGLLLIMAIFAFVSMLSDIRAKRIEGRNLALARLHNR